MCHSHVIYFYVVSVTSADAAHLVDFSSTKLIWFGSRQMLEKLTDCDLTLYAVNMIIHPVKSARDLGVYLDSEPTKVVSFCNHQLREIRQVRRFVGQDVAQQLVSTLTV